MTRSNFLIRDEHGQTVKFQMNSDGYPENVVQWVYKLVKSSYSDNYTQYYGTPYSSNLGDFIWNLNLTIGYVGNFSYHYEIDFEKKLVTVWEGKTYWVNAPERWEEKGYNCWKGSNGKYGYTNWKKGKKVLEKTFNELLNIQ